MRKFIKNTLFIFIIFMWIFYFSDIFLLRGVCISNNKKIIKKYPPIKTTRNITFYNNRNDSDFLTNYKTTNLNKFSFFHNNFYINSQSNFIKYQELTNEENLFLNLVNNYRKQNNLNTLVLNNELSNIANIKALDIKNNYNLKNNSQTLETLENILDSYNINYTSAKQNIITSKKIISAFETLSSSPSHNSILLTHTHVYTGLSIIDSTTFGKIIVQIFIQK